MRDTNCDILALQMMPMGELLGKYEALFGTKASNNNRKFLERKIAYRMQEGTAGFLSDTIKNRIKELIKAYDPINKIGTKSATGKTSAGRDARLPMPGSFIVKTYKGKRLEVKVLENGFEYESATYSNLSAIAKAVSGMHWNGYLFFGVKNNGRRK